MKFENLINNFIETLSGHVEMNLLVLVYLVALEKAMCVKSWSAENTEPIGDCCSFHKFSPIDDTSELRLVSK